MARAPRLCDGRLDGTTGSRSELGRIEEREHWIESPGGRVFAKTWTPSEGGSKTPVLLFHDSLGCVALWRDFPMKLAAALDRPVIAYDRLGFGRSDPRTDHVGWDFIAREAETSVPSLCTGLGFSEFIACGHSVGGGMAIETAAQFGHRCAAVVTIAAQAFVEDRTLDGLRLARVEFGMPETMARLARYHGDKAAWVLRAWIDTWLSPDFADWSLDPALRRIRCPLLAIHGADDEYGSTEHPRRIANGRGEMHILPGIGHTPHRECPDLLVETLESFFINSL